MIVLSTTDSTPESQSPTQGSKPDNRRSVSMLVHLIPFFMPAALYLSLVFAVFSALPLIYSQLKNGRLLSLVASAVNTAIVFAVAGRTNAAVFFVLAVVMSMAVGECARFRLRIEWAALVSILMMISTSGLLLFSYSQKFQVNPVEKLEGYIGAMVDQVVQNIERVKSTSQVSNQEVEKLMSDPELTKKSILFELPSSVLIALLVVVVANLLVALKWNLSMIRGFFKIDMAGIRKWKAPDHMVWPTLLSAALLIVDVKIVSDVALNVFKVLMAVYALQGMAIASSLFDVWGVRGVFRPIGYIFALVLLLPLVISLGFFDLWFNFREKLKS